MQNSLASLLQNRQNLTPEDMNALDQFLSSQTISGNGDQAVMGDSNQLAALLQPPPQQPPAMNTMRNNATGAQYAFNSQPQSTQLDYASPIEIGGYGKGYRVKGDPFSVQLADGRKVSLGRNVAAEQARAFDALKMQKAQAELESQQLQNRDAANGTKSAPAGYRYTPTGNLEAIPGGPADIKAGIEGKKADLRQQVLTDQADTVLNTVAEAKKNVGATTAGYGGLLSGLPMTNARKLAGQLETIKANLGFDRLQQMRDMSPTGGALGQVAVQELTALRSTVASLDQLQDPKDVEAALGKIEQHYTKWKETLQSANGNKDTSAASGPAIGSVVKGYRFKGGNPADRTSWEPAK